MRVKVEILLDIDENTWALANGISPDPDEIAEDVKSYFGGHSPLEGSAPVTGGWATVVSTTVKSRRGR